MTNTLFVMLFAGVPCANFLLGVGLLVHFVSFVKGEHSFGDWFGFWAAGLVLSVGGFVGFMQGGIWAVLLGTILYIIAAWRTRRQPISPTQP